MNRDGGPAPGLQPERTALAWRRTVLAACALGCLMARDLLPRAGGAGAGAWAGAGATAALVVVVVLLLTRRRPPRPMASGVLPAALSGSVLLMALGLVADAAVRA